uniref:AlNc14C170G7985 protein n=1 Tax=Albugo laibachii Nc14 TaxID=890382 RepID=F0WNG0_9STRA|nr:AlNc14C170G7985 [Albugo laibachii Nc14]|eukprot:CCA22851.1 AlNc14C170G7985 [Albugo laibachii Nc14]
MNHFREKTHPNSIKEEQMSGAPRTVESTYDRVQTQLSHVSRAMLVIKSFSVSTALTQILAGFLVVCQMFELDFTLTLIALYTSAFALLLLCFECRLELTHEMLLNNFGFFFHYRGYAAVLFFIGILDVGIAHAVGWIGCIAGVLAITTGLLALCLGLFMPNRSKQFEEGFAFHSSSRSMYGTNGCVESPIDLPERDAP